MEQQLGLLKELCDAHGVMGDEEQVLEVVKKELDRQGVSYRQLPFGDIVCGQTDKPKLLLAAHSDEVGFLVHKIHEDGTLGVTNLGWVKPNMLNETAVYVKTLSGERVRGQGFARVGLLSQDVPSFADVYVDVGASNPAEVEKMGIRVGDTGTYNKEFWSNEHAVFASSLDNRLGVYGLLSLLQSNRGLLDKAAVCFHTHEEADFEGLRGVVSELKPEFALIADMFPVQHKFASNDTPILVGGGPAVLYQAGRYVIHYPLRKVFEALPQDSFQKAIIDTGPIEIEPLSVQGNGRTMATNVFYPVRGYHKSVYSVRFSDIEKTQQLLQAASQKILG